MPLDWQSPLVSFDRQSQPEAGAPAYDQSVTGQRLAADGYPDDWIGPIYNQAADGYPDDWVGPGQKLAADGYPDDWIGPIYNQAADGYPDDWVGPGQKLAADGYPDDWVGPIHGQADDGYPNNWGGPAQIREGYGSPIPQPGPPAFSLGSSLPGAGSPDMAPSRPSLADLSPDQSARPNNWAAAPAALGQPTSSGLVSPVSYQTDAKPWWIPMGPGTGFEPWADHFIKGIQGLINYFRSRQTLGNANGPGCDEEWDYARRKCAELLAQRNPPRGVTGGYRNIEDCARGLVSERCGGNPVRR